MVATDPILSASGISKSFPGVRALHDITFDLLPAEIHALCGENGAGKSTLIKLLSGIHAHGSYSGTLSIHGRLAEFTNVADAEKAGIAVIYQELALVPEMSIAENIFLGSEPTRRGLIDWDRIDVDTRAWLERFGLTIEPAAKVGGLGMGQRQLIEIIKALRKDTKILILDEPTAALTDDESASLLRTLQDLQKRGIACIYISHKLDEVFAVADRITVIRDGENVFTSPVARTDKNEIVRHMVGREIKDFFPRRKSAPGDIRLKVSGLTVAKTSASAAFLKNVSFDVRAGEVLGLGGLMGSGRTELLMHLFGAWGHRISGAVEFSGHAVSGLSPQHAVARGLVLVSEDRKRYGLVLDQDLGFNLTLSSLARLSTAGLLDKSRLDAESMELFRSLKVKAPALSARAGGLSGGNQQKIVIGKALMTRPQVIFLDEPTRGIDVGAKLEVYEIINRLTADGKAVVLVSSELPELMGMSDRIIMLHEGAVGGRFNAVGVDQEALISAAMGQLSKNS